VEEKTSTQTVAVAQAAELLLLAIENIYRHKRIVCSIAVSVYCQGKAK
jgi:hypothetical protein